MIYSICVQYVVWYVIIIIYITVSFLFCGHRCVIINGVIYMSVPSGVILNHFKIEKFI